MLLAACQSDFCHVTGTVNGIADGDTLLLTTQLLPTDGQLPDTVTIVVQNGSFTWETEADTACLYRLWPIRDDQHAVTFFTERGNVSISIRQQHTSFSSFISGTRLNDEWQSLNDMAISYSQRISRTVSCLLSAGTPPSLVRRRVNELYEELERNISDAAERNKDNELGRFIKNHHVAPVMTKREAI